jgi:hypothetical protein
MKKQLNDSEANNFLQEGFTVMIKSIEKQTDLIDGEMS